jgi:hypothetical protein
LEAKISGDYEDLNGLQNLGRPVGNRDVPKLPQPGETSGRHPLDHGEPPSTRPRRCPQLVGIEITSCSGSDVL